MEVVEKRGRSLLLAGLILVVGMLDLVTPPTLVVLSLMWIPVVASAAYARPTMTCILGVWAFVIVLVVGLLQGYYQDPSFWVRTVALATAAGVAAILAQLGQTRERQLHLLATTDSLTGLANRHRLLAWLDRELSEEIETPLAVLYIDLDGFKLVNTCHGHAGGDAVLVEVARRLAGEVDEHAIVARLGGDEFVVAYLLTAESPGAAELCERLIKCVTQSSTGPSDIPLGATIGAVVVQPGTNLTKEAVIDQADALLMGLKEARPGAYAVQGIS